MLRSFRYLASALILIFISSITAVFGPVIKRVSEVWPRAFPATASLPRTLGVRLSVEDAKPAAHRVRAYQTRVAERHQPERRAIHGLILAI